MVQMHERAAELVAQARAAGTGAQLVVGPVHDVVGEQLRAAVEQLGQRLLPVLGVELVLLLHRHPGKPAALLGDLAGQLGVLGLQGRKLIAGGLPFLVRSDRVLWHVLLLWHLLTQRKNKDWSDPWNSSPAQNSHFSESPK